MGVFYILLFVPLMIQHLVTNEHKANYEKKNQWALAFFFIWLTLIVMLRHKNVGSDTNSYIYYFKSFSRMPWRELGKNSLELGYIFFNKTVSLFSKEPQVFLGVVAITVSAMIYPTYRRLNIDPSLTIVLFCTMSTFVMMFSGIRQMIAIGAGFVAYEFTRNKRLLPYILTVLLALTLHTSAFMLAFMYPLYHTRITKKWLFAVVPVLVVTFVFNGPLFSILSLVIERYAGYQGGVSSTGAYTMLLLFILFTVFAFLIPAEERMDAEAIGLRNFMLLALVLQMFAPLHTLAMRMNYYYIIFIPLLLPKIIACRSERWEQVAIWGRHIMVLFFLIYFFINASNGGGLKVFPYHFFWEKI